MLVGGDTRQRMLIHLLERRDGLTVDELSTQIGISKSAVKQHLSGLERDGQVARGASRKTGGRPEHIYVLTDTGMGAFPKQYSWFSRVLLDNMRRKLGDAELETLMYELGVDLSAQALPRVIGKTRIERVIEIVKIMNETGFVARVVDGEPGEALPRVECQNCVYHDLSKDYPAVCRFDIGFLSGLMGTDIEHQECMQRGGTSCRFRFMPLA